MFADREIRNEAFEAIQERDPGHSFHKFPSEVNCILKKAERQYDTFWIITPDIGGKANMQPAGFRHVQHDT